MSTGRKTPNSGDRGGRSESTPSKARVPRPDELSSETLEFIAAIDEYKRSRMVSNLTLEEILEVVRSLGYLRSKDEMLDEDEELERALMAQALEAYKESHGRLFPNWSEIFQIIRALGYIKVLGDNV